MAEAARKWRPSLGLITAALIASVFVLPLTGLVFFRVYENQLLRETEGELIAQSAMLSAVLARDIAAAPADAFPIGAPRPPAPPTQGTRYAPIPPSLDLALARILPQRAAAMPALTPADPRAIELGARLMPVLSETQRTTLAGFRVLDAHGVVIAGREEVGLSLAHLAEVQAALSGHVRVTLRQRVRDAPPPPLYSISRATKTRVFIAFPVFVNDRVRAVVLMSRTPDNIVRNLYTEREKLFWAGLLTLAIAIAVGAAFVRTISRPLADLVARAEAIAKGERAAIGPLKRHGTQEMAQVTAAFMDMAQKLSDRSDYLSTFANHVSHELKTPLTSLKGAVELLRDNDASMSAEERARFLQNIAEDGERMSLLLERLRDLARADNPGLGGACTLGDIRDSLAARFASLTITCEGDGLRLPMSLENARIVFENLADNASKHGARIFKLRGEAQDRISRILISDDGAGISSGNRARVFDAFFTTRRDEGGAGMGLMIVRAMLRAHGGDIMLGETEEGAAFVISLPLADPSAPMAPSLWGALRRLPKRLGRGAKN